MEQSTKLFLVLGFMFLLYVTMKGNLQRYLALLFGGSGSGGSSAATAASDDAWLKNRFDEIRKGILK